MFPGQMGYAIPAMFSGSALESPPSWRTLEYIQREASKRPIDQMPEQFQLAVFKPKEQYTYSKLLNLTQRVTPEANSLYVYR